MDSFIINAHVKGLTSDSLIIKAHDKRNSSDSVIIRAHDKRTATYSFIVKAQDQGIMSDSFFIKAQEDGNTGLFVINRLQAKRKRWRTPTSYNFGSTMAFCFWYLPFLSA